MAKTKAKRNEQGLPVCNVCGSRTNAESVAYCSAAHAELDGGKYVDPDVNPDANSDLAEAPESDGGGVQPRKDRLTREFKSS